MLNTVIDPQVFSMQRRGGISRYFVELIKNSEIFEQHGVELMTPYRRVLNSHAADDLPDRFRMLPNEGYKLGRVLVATRAAQNRVATRGDVIHHTYYDPRFLVSRGRRSRVCTVYDMIPEKFPDLFPNGNPHLSKREFVEQSDRIIAISTQTKNDLMEIYGTAENRITVIPLGVSRNFVPRPSDGSDSKNRPYLLFVGNRSGYKNFVLLAQALSAGSGTLTEFSLVAVGGGAFSDEEKALLDGLDLTHRVSQVSASESELAVLYANAVAMIFPSQYEGFGLPVLEAMATGCPALLARTGSLPEVGGEAALYFDPNSVDELVSALETIGEDPIKRALLRSRGLARAEAFTWEATAQKTASLYAAM